MSTYANLARLVRCGKIELSIWLIYLVNVYTYAMLATLNIGGNLIWVRVCEKLLLNWVFLKI